MTELAPQYRIAGLHEEKEDPIERELRAEKQRDLDLYKINTKVNKIVIKERVFASTTKD